MTKVVCEKEELIDAMDNARVELNWLVKVMGRLHPEKGTVLAGGLDRLQAKSSDTAVCINQLLLYLKGEEKW